MIIFTGNANKSLAEKVARFLNIPLGKARIEKFGADEIMVELLEDVRGRDVFILQATSFPVNDNLMELLVMADALKRASANRITAVVSYFGYARQDRRAGLLRVPITAKLIADIMTCSGISRLVTVELHSEQTQGFFSIPVDNIYTTQIILQDILQRHYENISIVAPDVGSIARANAISKRLSDTDFVVIDKRRIATNVSELRCLIGNVNNRNCIIIDDLIDTAGTICMAARELKKQGATGIYVYATHAVLSGDAVHNIEQSSIDEVIVTDTIQLNAAASRCKKIRQISIADMLAKVIRHLHVEQSISAIFE